MLFPQSNTFRQVVDLSGVWEFCFDEADTGRENGFDDGRPIKSLQAGMTNLLRAVII